MNDICALYKCIFKKNVQLTNGIMPTYQRTNHSLTRGRVAQASLPPLLTPHVQSCTN